MRPPETPVITIRLVEEWGKRPVGTVLEVDATRADWLIERGYAERAARVLVAGKPPAEPPAKAKKRAN